MPIHLPPLRDRTEDIPTLIDYFISFLSKNNNKKLIIDASNIEIFKEYNWPGNIQELRNIVERLFLISNGKKITKTDISAIFPCYSLVFGFNNILLNDSSYRREFINTGMFHVEPESRKSFNVFEKALKQRNFLLKSKKYDSIGLWERQLIDANNKLSGYRESYFKCLNNHFSRIIESIKKVKNCGRAGWLGGTRGPRQGGILGG